MDSRREPLPVINGRTVMSKAPYIVYSEDRGLISGHRTYAAALGRCRRPGQGFTAGGRILVGLGSATDRRGSNTMLVMAAQRLTTAQAAALIGCSVRNVQKAIESGALAAEKIGRDWWIKPADAERYARSDRRPGPKKGRKQR